jgi:ribonuclease HI
LKKQEKKALPMAVTAVAPCWIPPPQGHVKINVYAGVGKKNGQGTVDVIARSAQREYMGSSSLVFPDSTDPETLEILACREACALAGDLSLRWVRVATDCSNVVRGLERGTMGAYAHIV